MVLIDDLTKMLLVVLAAVLGTKIFEKYLRQYFEPFASSICWALSSSTMYFYHFKYMIETHPKIDRNVYLVALTAGMISHILLKKHSLTILASLLSTFIIHDCFYMQLSYKVLLNITMLSIRLGYSFHQAGLLYKDARKKFLT